MNIQKGPTGENTLASFIKIFKFLGLMPYTLKKIDYRGNTRSKYVCNRAAYVLITCCLIFYWMGFSAAFVQAKKNMDIISRVINYFQMTMSGIAMTTIFVSKMRNVKTFNLIVTKFYAIDQQLNYLGNCSKNNDNIEFRRFYMGFLVSIVYMVLYNLCSYIIYMQRPVQPLWYYILANIPIIFYSFVLVEAFSLLNFLNTRYHALNAIVVEFNYYDKSSNDFNKNEKLQHIFNAMDKLIELNKRIGEYFGAILLSVFATLFTIATVQSYYIYLTIANFEKLKGLDANSLTHALLMDVTCFILLIGITSMCQKLTDTSKNVINNLSKNIKNTEVGECFFDIVRNYYS